MAPPNKFRNIRCKWYNDFGYPRINPAKLERGLPDPTGCTRTTSKCFYVHPDHSDWDNANFAHPPKKSEYPDNRVPRTPDPPLARARRSTRTPEPRVKPEPESPKLPMASDRSMSGERGSPSKVRSKGSHGPLSPSYVRDRGRERSRSRDKVRDYYRDSDMEQQERERERTYGLERDYDWERDRDRDGDRDRDWEYSREEKERRDSSRLKSISFGDRGESTRSPPRPGASLLDRVFDRKPVSPLVTAPMWPAVSRNTQHASDRRPQPPSDSPPSLPPPPPLRPPSRSSVASSSGLAQSAAPENAIPMDRLSMPPPPTPVSAASTTTAYHYSVPPIPKFLGAPQPQEAAQKEPLSREEQAELWDKRIELLGEAIAAKRAYGERVADIKQLRALATLERTAHLPPAVREQITSSVEVAQAQVDAARARAKAAHQKVLELDFWPVRRRPELYDSTKEEGEDDEKALIEDEHSEIKQRVTELGDAISRIDRQMKEVTQFVAARARSGALSMSSSHNSVPMDWEASDIARGVKRRKIGDDGAYASDSGSATLGPLSPAPSAPTSTDAVHSSRLIAHRVAKLESSFHELENLYTQAEAHAQEELSAMVDIHVERVREQLVRGVKMRHSERVDRLEEEAAHMDKEVQELVREITSLLSVEARVMEVERSVAEERERIERERAELRAAMDEHNSRTSAMQAQIAANLEETHALRRALTLITQKPPTPAPHIPTVDDLAAALLPRLLDAVRADLEPRLIDQKADIVKLMRESAPQLDAVRERIEKVVQLPDVLALMQNSGVLNLNGSPAGLDSAKENGTMKTDQMNLHELPVPRKPSPSL